MNDIKKMNNVPRSTPWFDWEEWVFVFQGLYSPNLLENCGAIEIVSLWKLRGKIPHSADTTAQLVAIASRDYNAKLGWGAISEMELRLLYSVAIIRSVNGLVDKSQQGVFAESVLQLANRIGLPGWLVELRHDATHNDLPSLSVLRAGCRHLLGWLKHNYWEPQLFHLTALSSAILPKLATSTENIDDTKLVSIGENSQSKKASAEFSITTLLSESSPSLLLDIVLPLFVETTINVPLPMGAPDSESSGALTGMLSMNRFSNLVTSVNNQESLWRETLCKIEAAHSSFIASVVCHLVEVCLDIMALVYPGRKRESEASLTMGLRELYSWKWWLARTWIHRLCRWRKTPECAVTQGKDAVKSDAIAAVDDVSVCCLQSLKHRLASFRSPSSSSSSSSSFSSSPSSETCECPVESLCDDLIAILDEFCRERVAEMTLPTAAATTTTSTTTTENDSIGSSKFQNRKNKKRSAETIRENSSRSTGDSEILEKRNNLNGFLSHCPGSWKTEKLPTWPLGFLPATAHSSLLYRCVDITSSISSYEAD